MLLGIPLAVTALPNDNDPHIDGGTLVDANHHLNAVIDEILLLGPPPPVTGRTGDYNNESLVEGHTVFLTLTIHTYRNVTKGNVTVLGNVSCGFETGMDTETNILGIPIPRKTRRTTVECRDNERVVATPDPFFDPLASNTPLMPTGDFWTVTFPSGEVGTIEEFVFNSTTTDDQGTSTTQNLYAWSAPILDGWTHADGTTKRFMIQIPEDKVWDQDATHYQIVFGNEVGIE